MTIFALLSAAFCLPILKQTSHWNQTGYQYKRHLQIWPGWGQCMQTNHRHCYESIQHSSRSFSFWTNNGAWTQLYLPNISFNIMQPSHLSSAELGNALSFALLQGKRSKHSQQPGTYWVQRCSPRVWQVETVQWSSALTGWTSAPPQACLTSAGPCEGSSCLAGREHLQWIKRSQMQFQLVW